MTTVFAAFDFPKHPLAREDGERVRGQWHRPPDAWLTARHADELLVTLNQAHALAVAGAWVLGGLRYEAASALTPHLTTQPSEGLLAAFAVYQEAPEPWLPLTSARERCTPWRQALHSPQQDAQSIEHVRDFIRAGDCYQVNLTTRLASALAPGVSLVELFHALHAAQPGGFSLFLAEMAGEGGVASVSPELFFDWRPLVDHPATWLLAAQPMKGTAARGSDRASDEAAQTHLRTSAKERAENLMIVDLLRNDLGRVAQTGSVRVPRLFELHELPTVWQMTSTVTAITHSGLRLSDVFGALFPCGSVTGAPKRRAMEVIQELEAAPRGWYCGALGLLQPGGSATFNVPIRTVEAQGSQLRAGIGSGITLDAEPEPELAEWRAKTRFLERARAPIAALETLRLQDGAYPQRAAHVARLAACARHFGLRHSPGAVQTALNDLAGTHAQGAWRVRLTLQADGQAQATAQPLADTPSPVQLVLAQAPMPTQGPLAEFIQYKTTRRELYDAHMARKPEAAWDVILFNELGELTEGCFGNIALQINGDWLTPRREAGLLPGVGRAQALAAGRVREARLMLDDLQRAQGLAWFNALRGWLPAQLLQVADIVHR